MAGLASVCVSLVLSSNYITIISSCSLLCMVWRGTAGQAGATRSYHVQLVITHVEHMSRGHLTIYIVLLL